MRKLFVYIDRILYRVFTNTILLYFDQWRVILIRVIAIAKHTFEKLNTKDSKDQQEEQNDKQYIKQCWDWLE